MVKTTFRHRLLPMGSETMEPALALVLRRFGVDHHTYLPWVINFKCFSYPDDHSTCQAIHY